MGIVTYTRYTILGMETGTGGEMVGGGIFMYWGLGIALKRKREMGLAQARLWVWVWKYKHENGSHTCIAKISCIYEKRGLDML